MSDDTEVQLIVRMPARLRRELKHRATARDTSMSEIVRTAIVAIVEDRPAAVEARHG